MTNAPTFQELLADFSDKIFIGRSEHLALFKKAITMPRPPFLILFVSGPEGVGKTALLQQFNLIAEDYQVLTARTNEDQTTIAATLLHLAHQFEADGHSLPNFIAHYQQQNQPTKDNAPHLGAFYEDLTYQFLKDLNHHAQKHRIVLFFDAYEQVSSVLDNWLREIFVGKYGSFSSHILFVIASRRPLAPPWIYFKRAVRRLELRNFTEAEAREYLEYVNITEEKEVQQLLELSSYVPASLTALLPKHTTNHKGAKHLHQGCHHFQAQLYPMALVNFSKAIELEPENDHLYHWRGRTYWEMGRPTAALADFTKAIELQPYHVNHYHWRGLAYRKTEHYAEAVADFSKAIELQPDNSDNYWARGYTYREAEAYADALRDFSKAIELQPQNINYYYWRGRTYLELKDVDSAWTDFFRMKDLLYAQREPVQSATNGRLSSP